MKYSKTMLTTLVAAAAMSVPAFAETPAYSGTIYTWSGRVSSGTDLAYGTYYTTTYNEDGTVSYSASTSGARDAWSAVQGIIARDSTSAPLNTLRFTALDTLTDETYSAGTLSAPTYAFAPLALAGIIVEEGATGFSIASSGTGGVRHIYLGNQNGTTAYTTINENFTLSNTNGASGTTFVLRGTQEWTIASGKTFTLNAFASAGVTATDGASISVSGGGTVAISKLSAGTGTITFDGVTTGGVLTGSSIFTTGDESSVTVNSVGTGWTGTVELKNISSVTNFNLNSYGVAGSKIVLDGITGYFLDASTTFAADIEIGNNGFSLNNGYSTNGLYTFSGSLTGSGNWTFDKSTVKQRYVFTGDVSGYEGDFSLTGADDSYVQFGNGGEGTTSGSVSGMGTISGNFSVVYNYSNDVYASNVISGSTSLTKQGAGTLTLTGANTFTGGVTVSAGTLDAANTNALGTGAVSVEASASLKLSVANVSAGSVTFAEGAKLVLANELLASSASLLDVDSAESIALTLLAANSITFNEETLSSDTLSSFTSSYVEFGSAFADYEKAFSYDSGVLSLTLTAIPEPSAFGLLAGVGALALVAARRRRSRAK